VNFIMDPFAIDIIDELEASDLLFTKILDLQMQKTAIPSKNFSSLSLKSLVPIEGHKKENKCQKSCNTLRVT